MIKKDLYLSVVSPVYLAEDILDELVTKLKDVLVTITNDFEIILVDDGSDDNSWQKIIGHCEIDSRIKGVKLSRNFGQHYAITAGLKQSEGNYVIVIDCDLQENPKYIKDLLNKKEEGFDIVLSRTLKKKQNFIKNFGYLAYNRLFNILIDNQDYKIDNRYCTLSLLSKKAVDAFLQIKDHHRHYILILIWLGFSKAIIFVEHEPRQNGISSYSFNKLFHHAINGIVSHSDKLLWYSVYAGFSLSLVSFFSIFYIVVKSIYSGFLPGWASIVSLIIFSTGLILISLGIVGLYIGKIFDQTKQRPLYIIDKLKNFSNVE
ncbi:MAG: hypothetical protein CBE24_01890 [bacterium TMED264]|nr:MAG: hypothetical protein CBE24_01890 [bacterium TMED264]